MEQPARVTRQMGSDGIRRDTRIHTQHVFVEATPSYSLSVTEVRQTCHKDAAAGGREHGS